MINVLIGVIVYAMAREMIGCFVGAYRAYRKPKTGTGVYTVPPGATQLEVHMVGGGGGGVDNTPSRFSVGGRSYQHSKALIESKPPTKAPALKIITRFDDDSV